MATYAIGDLQGCYDELCHLLEACRFDTTQDQLWVAGDLVNRGPKSLLTLELLYSMREQVRPVLGNHDLHLLAVASGVRKPKRGDTLDAVLESPNSAALLEWLRQQPLMHYDAELNYAMVHAGVSPHWSLKQAQRLAAEVETVLRGPKMTAFLERMYGNENQCWDEWLEDWQRWRVIVNYFTRMRFCQPDGTLEFHSKEGLESAPPGFYPWFQYPCLISESTRLIFGHWAALGGVTHSEKILALDTGCVWGNRLTALRLDDGMLMSVPSQQPKRRAKSYVNAR
ncbi:bis(5'-nucleosyl)-tetraphosphatase (symmetrical) [Allopseudospirillum japonicum]|uniref:Bis(5'-nucleosyl)-tetraphosphatase, symmetrical n=1 Tax=Allopseudospirillum japonicum TaxID=64971 RepID=A0A1H6TEE4_9GAMM|nr:symmetrical bis(5'-nucleosyl)-tetraphosphatase [Allopseudospirillum japonicum]SEI74660.1 bis(5'-nucleosyl)-tetraphosphatase (symmetrical) [Allopseudospirillum japonicum]